jgi:hypothetical protein
MPIWPQTELRVSPRIHSDLGLPVLMRWLSDRSAGRDRFPEVRRSISVPSKRLDAWRSSLPASFFRSAISVINDPVLLAVG